MMDGRDVDFSGLVWWGLVERSWDVNLEICGKIMEKSLKLHSFFVDWSNKSFHHVVSLSRDSVRRNWV